ncbi:MAG: GspE/PulE family protein [Clostridium sp.]
MFGTKQDFNEGKSKKDTKWGMGHDFKSIANININPQAVVLLPRYFCEKHNIIPVDINTSKRTINILSLFPLINITMEDIKFICGYDPVLIYVENKKELEGYIHDYFINNKQNIITDSNITTKGENCFSELDSPAIKLVNHIFKEATKLRASDIHIEPFKKYYNIRLRVDGILREVLRLSKSSFNSVISRIKVLSKIDISEKRLPLDGRISFKSNNKLWDFRVSTMPTINGEKIVIRLFQEEERKEGLNDIGLLNENLNVVKKFLGIKSGIVLVAGPTGSGKSTTLYTLIKQLNLKTKNIITIEDPVEQSMEGITQINVNQSIGFDFASGLRSILRQDPDVIMIGEIRDKETACIAMRAAITGHVVFSTIHTFDCASVIDRLLDMNVESYMIASGISAILSQRLVRRICAGCSEEYVPSEFEVNMLKITKQDKLLKGNGCKKCGYTGYSGRIGVFEVMEIKDFHREAIMLNKGSSYIKSISVEDGMKTLEISCRDLVLKGITTTCEMLNICNIKN